MRLRQFIPFVIAFITFAIHPPCHAQQAVERLINPTPQGSGSYGLTWARIAIDNDTIAISSDHSSFFPEYELGGIIHVFHRAGDDWALEDTLRPPVLVDDDYFGYHLALEGDLIAARYYTDRNGDAIPGVYIFRRVGQIWSLEHDLTNILWPRVGSANSLAIVNGTLLIGMDSAPGAPAASGAVAIVRETRDGWAITGYLPLPALDGGDGFGSALAVSGDRCVVGAPFYRADNEGGAFVYQLVAGEWELEQEITVPVVDQHSEFGGAVAINGDILAVNDPRKGHDGSTYIYRRDEKSGLWVQEAELTTSRIWSGYVLALGDDFVISAGRPYAEGFSTSFTTHYFDGAQWNQGYSLDCVSSGSACTQLHRPRPGQVFAIQQDKLIVRIGQIDRQDGETAALVGGIGAGLANDCNGNHIDDQFETFLGNPDCNGNDILDECEKAPETDCNNNGWCDGVEEDYFPDFADCNNDGMPDECEDFDTDSDGDGTADFCDNCELYNPDQRDCDNDGIGDTCAIAAGTVEDCNKNGVPDWCEDTYLGDGGTPTNHWVGNNSDFDCVCLQAYVATTGNEVINGISVYWTHYYARPATLMLYNDPNNDGDPTDAELLWQTNLLSGTRRDGFVTYPVPDVFVGHSGRKFFVGVAATGESFPVWEGTSVNSTLGRWIAAENIGEFNPYDLASMELLPPDFQDGFGPWMIRASASPRAKCGCVADLASNDDGGPDGEVNTSDLIALLAAWGSCGEPCPPLCAADLNGDCAVNVADLFFLLSQWGLCE